MDHIELSWKEIDELDESVAEKWVEWLEQTRQATMETIGKLHGAR